ncbi:hypothetical protein AMIS_66930 [Actinoplanes missouriensis 431]|uniref:Uncharacterized protein n=1 Tax=Actinoplanes missouriensis (strain ATCC 14538 / DSM 43046 / CBS 188.64 / JCM 3121 / NBRC 102363 / NCIMB 12654 / NRRL B-3342 / UNCC 431) TaxID=512565 RepID=I0HFX6_ACTM4|nr:hypothetical protein AMIS_66930 [Actinoplanes missouriensis 431]
MCLQPLNQAHYPVGLGGLICVVLSAEIAEEWVPF